MKLDGRIEIAAPAVDVWAFILDPERLGACVPGARNVRKLDDRTFAGSVTAAVGPMQSDFDFTTVVVRADFPGDLGVELTGTDSMTKSSLTAEVAIALDAQKLLAEQGVPARVVSVPCLDLLERQDAAMRRKIIGDAPVKIAVEAAIRQGWDSIIGADGVFVGMSTFGASAPLKKLYDHFGINAAAVAKSALDSLKKG